MGVVKRSEFLENGKVLFEVEMNYEECLELKGHIKEVYLFSEDAAEIKTNLAQRGTNEATKYFLIPKDLRKGLQFKEKVKCQKIETSEKSIFIFVVKKLE